MEITFWNHGGTPLRIIEWNIKHGGSRRRMPGIIDSIGRLDADIAILTEFHCDSEEIIRQGLAQKGLKNIINSNPMPRTNGILAASKEEISQIPIKHIPPELRHRWLELFVPCGDFRLLCVHIPTANKKKDKETFWKSILAYAGDMEDERALMIGDFNTGLKQDAQGTPFVFSNYMDELISKGWTDAWRVRNPEKREYTWYSNENNGFRLDYAFSSPRLRSEVIDVRYSHEPRQEGHSDHSTLILEMTQPSKG
jgi:exonuclease III